MTQTLIIAARELRERRFVVLTAVFIAALPFAGALMPLSRRYGPSAFIGGAGGILAVSFTLILAMILGATMVGRELSERRLSFYFSKPVSAAAIWFGKLIGALALVGISFAIIFLPSLSVARGAWSTTWDVEPLKLTAMVLGASIFLVLITHAAGTMIRSRSAVAAIDLVALSIVIGAVMTMTRSLFEALALKLTVWLVAAMLLALLVALIGAGAWQLSRGRADVQRSHREMSRFLWVTMAGALVIAGGYVAWVFTAGPDDLTKTEVAAAQGDWIVVGGPARLRGDYHPAFLMNVNSGEWSGWRWSVPDFTRNGAAVVALKRDLTQRMRWNQGELIVQRLGKGAAPVETGIMVERDVVVSDDVQRAAVISDKIVSIHDLQSQRLLASAALPRATTRRGSYAFFPSPDVVRVIEIHREGGDSNEAVPLRLRILELDVNRRKITETGSWETFGRFVFVRATADGSTLVAMVSRSLEGKPGAVLLDGRTAEVKASLPTKRAGLSQWRILKSGRIVVLSSEPEGALKVFGADGSPLPEIALGTARSARVIGETPSGKVVVAMHPAEMPERDRARGWQTFLVDVEQGRVVRQERDIRPLHHWWSTDPRVTDPSATFVITDADGALWRWNAETGEKKKII